MAIQLTKGQNVALTKGVTKFKVGLSWDFKDASNKFDLDVLAIEVDNKTDGKAIGENYLVFYNSALKTADGKPRDPESAVIHSGDNRDGSGDGDDETITVDVTKLNPLVKAIIFVINIYNGLAEGKNFGQVKNPKVRLYEGDSDTSQLMYELDEDYSDSVCMEFCMIYKNNDEWKFKALGEGNQNDLLQEMHKYGIPAEGNA